MPGNRPSAPDRAGHGRWAGGSVTDDDVFALITLMAFAVPAGLVAVPGWRDPALHWLVDHHVLVTAAAHPIWTLPGDVAGLDARRLVLAAVVVLAVLTFLSSWAWHRHRRLLHSRLTGGDRS
ncbi:hypothetical protein [Nocardia transvalensis]|uniref:hypothetical protein n=1 Tax=Nocardia transvalensis TaxID=37333 RepID=UPI001893B814|nr:hypothetical protein [Nocardia transvalensis]MBF6333527.1 hypothetical protein [Nocardia transvalensis]